MQQEQTKQTPYSVGGSAKGAVLRQQVPQKPPRGTTSIQRPGQSEQSEVDQLEHWVPPPKKRIGEDTPINATAAPDQSYSLVNYSS